MTSPRSLRPHRAVAGLALSAALLGLSAGLTGCQNQSPVAQGNGPAERVAGERQEDQTLSVIRTAGLPERFFFGGRVWEPHQLHKVDPANPAGGGPAGDPASSSTAGSTGTGTGTASGAENATNGPAGTAAEAPEGVGGFVPVGALKVDGHQIYRKKDLDEAVTDNIYLRVEAATESAAGATGTAASPSGETMEPKATTPGPVITFVEYDAARSAEGVELPQLLTAVNLPQLLTYNGKTFTAREMLPYDPDVFDTMQATAQPVQGHDALTGQKKDEVVLMGELSADGVTSLKMRAAEENATSTPPATSNTPEGAPSAPGAEPLPGGTVFIRYVEGDGGTGATGPASAKPVTDMSHTEQNQQKP